MITGTLGNGGANDTLVIGGATGTLASGQLVHWLMRGY